MKYLLLLLGIFVFHSPKNTVPADYTISITLDSVIVYDLNDARRIVAFSLNDTLNQSANLPKIVLNDNK